MGDEQVRKIRVGAQVHPQHTTMEQMRRDWKAVDDAGADTLFTWDHFFPISGDANGSHFEGFSQLAAMGAVTQHVQFGPLVSCISYRNPNLIADMARTIDHISGGRFILGVGAGWSERDFHEYGFDYKSGPERLRDLDAALPVVRSRLDSLNPPPVNGTLPILIGGGGEKVTLRIVAQHANIWNTFGSPEDLGRKSRVLDAWCEKVGRNPAEIERSVYRGAREGMGDPDAFVEQGITHIILGLDEPELGLRPLEELIAWRDSRNGS